MGLRLVIKIFKICCIAFLFLLCLVPLSFVDPQGPRA